MDIAVLGAGDEPHRKDFEEISDRFGGTRFQMHFYEVMDRAGAVPIGLHPAERHQRLCGCEQTGSRPVQWVHVNPHGPVRALLPGLPRPVRRRRSPRGDARRHPVGPAHVSAAPLGLRGRAGARRTSSAGSASTRSRPRDDLLPDRRPSRAELGHGDALRARAAAPRAGPRRLRPPSPVAIPAGLARAGGAGALSRRAGLRAGTASDVVVVPGGPGRQRGGAPPRLEALGVRPGELPDPARTVRRRPTTAALGYEAAMAVLPHVAHVVERHFGLPPRSCRRSSRPISSRRAASLAGGGSCSRQGGLSARRHSRRGDRRRSARQGAREPAGLVAGAPGRAGPTARSPS